MCSQEEEAVYEFYVEEVAVEATLGEALGSSSRGTETLLEIVYQPQAKFRVQSVTHCTSSIPGGTAGCLCSVCVCLCV